MDSTTGGQQRGVNAIDYKDLEIVKLSVDEVSQLAAGEDPN